MKLSKLQDGRKKPWRVRYHDGKKDVCIHFANSHEAKYWMRTRKIDPAEEITTEERLLIQWARARAEADGSDISDTIRQWVKTATVPDNAITLSEAAAAYKTDMERRNLRLPYRKNAEYLIDRFLYCKEDWPLSRITPEDVVTHCLTMANGRENQKTVRSRLITWLRWCREKGWTAIDTTKIRWRLPKTDQKPIGFFHPADVANFLQVIPDKIKFPMALLFFTGIRPKGEFCQIRYCDIDRDRKEILIPETASKTRRARKLYNLSDNLWEWYDRYAVKDGGKVCPMTYRNLRTHISAACKELDLTWHQDCTRHTFATCAFHRGLEWALDIMGHTDSRLFLKYYKGQITASEALGLWEIKPL